MLRSCDGGDQMGYKEVSFFLSVAATFLAAEFHLLPIARPFLAPFKFKPTSEADFRGEPVLDFCHPRHEKMV